MNFINVSNSNIYKPCDYSDVESVVDLSSFRPDSEQVRALKFNVQGSGSTPVYDYPDGTIPKDDPISPEIIALRSGKLDKADIDRLKNDIINDAKRENDSKKLEKVSQALEKNLGLDSDLDSVPGN